MKVSYKLKVIFRDGTGHTYVNLSRSKVASLTARQFASGLDRPESIEITTLRRDNENT